MARRGARGGSYLLSPEEAVSLMAKIAGKLVKEDEETIKSHANSALSVKRCDGDECGRPLFVTSGKVTIRRKGGLVYFYCARCADKEPHSHLPQLTFDEFATNHHDEMNSICRRFFGQRRWKHLKYGSDRGGGNRHKSRSGRKGRRLVISRY